MSPETPFTCEEVAARLVETGGQSGSQSEDQADAQSIERHLAGCAECRALARAQSLVQDRLRPLADAAAPPPPAALESLLRARLAERVRPARPLRRRTWTSTSALAALPVLALAAAAAYLLVRSPAPEPAPIAAPVAAVPLDSETASDLQAPADSAAGPPAQRFRALGLLEAERPLEARRVARVELATEVAAYLGWPLGPDPPGARVQADILYGEDGLARAVRFLPATFRAPAGKENPQ